MKAMIFAAGLGTRLKPLTDTMPKALVPIAGKTLLQWQIERLREAGICDIIINVHHFPDMIIDYLRNNDNFGCHITISDERDALLDTGGGLRKAWNMLATSTESKSTSEPILALNVDILSNISIPDLIRAYDGNNLLVVSERDTQRYLCFDEQNNMVGWTNIKTGEVKVRDGRHLAFSGMQILSPTMRNCLATMPADKFSLIDLYLHACQTETLRAYIPTDYRMMDVGKIDHLDEANAFARTLGANC